MKKGIYLAAMVLLVLSAAAQDSTGGKPKKAALDLSNRANDHLLIQFGMAGWSGTPDTINQSGFSKAFNLYLMFDFPFKSNPRLSMALGAGIGNDHIRFSKTDIGIKKIGATLPFTNTADTNHFEKTKLATTYLEIPVEFRFSADPLNGKGLKAAIGIKAGTLIDAHTRNSKYQNRSGNSLGDFVVKESGRRYFNRTRIVATARVGYGHLSLFGSYQLTNVFKDGQGPAVRTWALGIGLSGL